MELKLRDGRYTLLPGGMPETVTGAEETLQRVLMRLRARRGAFWPARDYGSRLYTLPRVRPSQREAAAREFVAEALAEETDADVRDVQYLPSTDGSAAVRVTLEVAGQETQVTVEV